MASVLVFAGSNFTSRLLPAIAIAIGVVTLVLGEVFRRFEKSHVRHRSQRYHSEAGQDPAVDTTNKCCPAANR